MSSTQATSTELCNGDSLASMLGIFWAIYLVANAAVFAGAIYGLRQFLEKRQGAGSKGKVKPRTSISRESSQKSLISNGKR